MTFDLWFIAALAVASLILFFIGWCIDRRIHTFDSAGEAIDWLFDEREHIILVDTPYDWAEHSEWNKEAS